MRFILILCIFAAFCIPSFASAKPTKVRLSPHDAKAKRDRGAAPSFTLRQTTWQEIKARQDLRKSPLHKRQQASATPAPIINYPTCKPFAPTVSVARYTATDITTPTATTSTRTTELACVQACQAYSTCKAYVWIPGTKMCYLKTAWTSASFSSTTTTAQTTGVISGLLGTPCKDAAGSGGVPEAFGAKCCNVPSSM